MKDEVSDTMSIHSDRTLFGFNKEEAIEKLLMKAISKPKIHKNIEPFTPIIVNKKKLKLQL